MTLEYLDLLQPVDVQYSLSNYHCRTVYWHREHVYSSQFIEKLQKLEIWPWNWWTKL